jgi:uncharacterized protein YggT (Ycf19 family)
MAVLTNDRGLYVLTPTEGHTVKIRGVARLSQFVDYAFWLLYALLMVRLLLVFFNVNAYTGFARFIDTITNPFYAPFRGLVANQQIDGGYVLAVPLVVAMLAYGLLHLAINKLLRVIAYRRTSV